MAAPLLVVFLHSAADNKFVAIVVTHNRGNFLTTIFTTVCTRNGMLPRFSGL